MKVGTKIHYPKYWDNTHQDLYWKGEIVEDHGDELIVRLNHEGVFVRVRVRRESVRLAPDVPTEPNFDI